MLKALSTEAEVAGKQEWHSWSASHQPPATSSRRVVKEANTGQLSSHVLHTDPSRKLPEAACMWDKFACFSVFLTVFKPAWRVFHNQQLMGKCYRCLYRFVVPKQNIGLTSQLPMATGQG